MDTLLMETQIVRLEKIIAKQIAATDARLKEHMAYRLNVEGEIPPAGLNENECAAWRRALNWVLTEMYIVQIMEKEKS
jgi:hypothetical protein